MGAYSDENDDVANIDFVLLCISAEPWQSSKVVPGSPDHEDSGSSQHSQTFPGLISSTNKKSFKNI